MKIGSYLKKHRLTQKEFALRIGVNPSMVSQWLTGRRGVGAKRAIIIERCTNGELSRRSLCPEVFGQL